MEKEMSSNDRNLIDKYDENYEICSTYVRSELNQAYTSKKLNGTPSFELKLNKVLKPKKFHKRIKPMRDCVGELLDSDTCDENRSNISKLSASSTPGQYKPKTIQTNSSLRKVQDDTRASKENWLDVSRLPNNKTATNNHKSMLETCKLEARSNDTTIVSRTSSTGHNVAQAKVVASSPETWITFALRRERRRGSLFAEIGALLTGPGLYWKAFSPTWRGTVITWFYEVAPSLKLEVSVVGRALHIFDSYLGRNVLLRQKVARKEFQVMASMALVIASKLNSTMTSINTADMKAFLADYRLISTEELTRSEHELLEVLDYNILGPSVQDFMDAMLEALQGICTRNHSLGLNFVNLEPLVHWASEFVRLLENSFRLIRYPPSEKARAVINCAVAKLSVMYVPMQSGDHEAELLGFALLHFHEDTTSLIANAWRQVLQSFKKVTESCEAWAETEILLLSYVKDNIMGIKYPRAPASQFPGL